jgi:four helix bundle protein
MTSDLLWRLDVVRLAGWAGQLAAEDVAAVRSSSAGFRVADQLLRAVGSIGANLWEGLGRMSPLERARFATYALGSVREAMSWYLLARASFPAETFEQRMELLFRIRNMLIALLRNLSRRLGRNGSFGTRA